MAFDTLLVVHDGDTIAHMLPYVDAAKTASYRGDVYMIHGRGLWRIQGFGTSEARLNMIFDGWLDSLLVHNDRLYAMSRQDERIYELRP